MLLSIRRKIGAIHTVLLALFLATPTSFQTSVAKSAVKDSKKTKKSKKKRSKTAKKKPNKAEQSKANCKIVLQQTQPISRLFLVKSDCLQSTLNPRATLTKKTNSLSHVSNNQQHESLNLGLSNSVRLPKLTKKFDLFIDFGLDIQKGNAKLSNASKNFKSKGRHIGFSLWFNKSQALSFFLSYSQQHRSYFGDNYPQKHLFYWERYSIGSFYLKNRFAIGFTYAPGYSKRSKEDPQSTTRLILIEEGPSLRVLAAKIFQKSIASASIRFSANSLRNSRSYSSYKNQVHILIGGQHKLNKKTSLEANLSHSTKGYTSIEERQINQPSMTGLAMTWRTTPRSNHSWGCSVAISQGQESETTPLGVSAVNSQNMSASIFGYWSL